MAMTTDITAKYRPSMSWFYDRVVADAVLNSVSPLLGRVRTATAGGGAVLEVGCGGGQFAVELTARDTRIQVTGIDLSAEQIARATARVNALPLEDSRRIHVRTASVSDIPFAEGSFDSVLSIASIKHWPDRGRGVSEMTRVLKDGGLLLIAEVDRSCHLEDVRRFVHEVHLPAALRIPYLWMFRTYIAGQGLDLDDARAAMADQPLADTTVQRIAGTPFLMMSGTKHA